MQDPKAQGNQTVCVHHCT